MSDEHGEPAGEALERLASLAGSEELEHVVYGFESEGDPGSEWKVRAAECVERLGRPYEATIDLVNEDLGAVPSLLLGHDATLTMQRGGLERRVRGIVRRLEYGATTDRFVLVRVHLVPALWALGQRQDSRIFQRVTVPEILEAVVGGALADYGRPLALELEREDYPKREYTVQYQETDLDFVHRLLEEEGLTYFFEHEDDAEKLVFVDSNRGFGGVPTVDDGPVPLVPQRGDVGHTEPVHALHRGSQLTPTAVTVRDFDWSQREPTVQAEVDDEDDQGRVRRLYDHARPLTIGDYDDDNTGRYQAHDAEAQARLRYEQATGDGQVLTGRGAVSNFAPGRVFELERHPLGELNGRYALVEVRHRGRAPELVGVAGDDGGLEAGYANEFVCLPEEVPYRPARTTPKPRVHGLQTAVVVSDGEEIHTDRHGRIKVQFHWDRQGQKDDRSSCWIRVMHNWAGDGWGFQFLPRVGMEVVVSFLDGDPDRPIVTGCVYDGSNEPPFHLGDDRDDKTKSGVRTQSSPGGDPEKYNELSFEDAAGQEEVYLQAQKDLTELVKNDHSTTVKGQQTNTVEGNQAVTVGGDRTVTVEQNQNVTVKKEHTLTAHEKIVLECGNSKLEMEPDKITVSCGSSQIVMDPSSIVSTAGDGSSCSLDQRVSIRANDEAWMKLDDSASLRSGSHEAGVDLDGGSVAVWGKQDLSATAEQTAQIVSHQGSQLKLTQDAELRSGSTTKVASDGASVELTPTDANISGPTVNLNS